jgi:hypothetical protein
VRYGSGAKDALWVVLKDFFTFSVFRLIGDPSKKESKTGKKFTVRCGRKSFKTRQRAAWTAASLSATMAARWET